MPPPPSGEDVAELVGGGVGAAVGTGVGVGVGAGVAATTDTVAVPLPHAGSGWFGCTAVPPSGRTASYTIQPSPSAEPELPAAAAAGLAVPVTTKVSVASNPPVSGS
jgi:hypothetical protein